MPAFDDFDEKGGTHGIDEVRRKNAARQKIDGIGGARFLVASGGSLEIEMFPEQSRVDALVFNFRERLLDGENIVNREEAGNTQFAGLGRQKPRHPVVAVDQIRFDGRNDVVDHFPLEREETLMFSQP
jgi:hypothetical protein